ncbi:hypothetical protein OEA41_003297 [Lepraria neglecta]|uniref:Enoyl-CoA hydratase n=1 Tax=Lepraria neglecta TaxID=209136 RepID=A0AAD9Z5R2_9LECA|nr:hypothetical protein OEA41_003297 [Lepraria neglecta]
MGRPSFQIPPPPTDFARLSFPNPHILLVTLSRPKSLNCINSAGNQELHAVWTWLDAEPSLRVGIVTGEGRAFCAGADLKEWNESQKPGATPRKPLSPSGFGGLSRRRGRKPVIAAVNGLAHGGGCEMIINCDIVLASPSAVFALPEAKRGLVALAGALPRLTRIVGRMRAMEMALTGRNVPAQEAKEWGLCNAVCTDGESVADVAVKWAEEICANSPDSIVVSKEGIELGWEGISAEEGSQRLVDGLFNKMLGGENMKEGVRAFVEKRRPKWGNSKL